jgi:tRNA G18 (ribose-2'-O)-methylase SpoU
VIEKALLSLAPAPVPAWNKTFFLPLCVFPGPERFQVPQPARFHCKGRIALKFEHIRYKPPRNLLKERRLLIACSPLRSHVNLSAIIRTAGCCGVREIVATGNARLVDRIARDGAEHVLLTTRNSLPPVLRTLRQKGYSLVGLEQTTHSTPLCDYAFAAQTALVVGAEREGLSDECLRLLDAVVEIPVWGMPFSHNVATATAMAIYEYCRQFPDG